jgi:hypothetical protein
MKKIINLLLLVLFISSCNKNSNNSSNTSDANCNDLIGEWKHCQQFSGIEGAEICNDVDFLQYFPSWTFTSSGELSIDYTGEGSYSIDESCQTLEIEIGGSSETIELVWIDENIIEITSSKLCP